MPRDPNVVIVYDGHCPFCTRFVRLLRMRASIPEVKLLDARQGVPGEYLPPSASLDEGMVVWVGNDWYHGAEAMHRLALLSTRSNSFNKLNYAVFSSRRLSGIFYPVLRFFRNMTLFVLRRRKLER